MMNSMTLPPYLVLLLFLADEWQSTVDYLLVFAVKYSLIAKCVKREIEGEDSLNVNHGEREEKKAVNPVLWLFCTE